MPDDVDALNAGFAGQLLEQYLENPASVPEEWRALFEQGDDTELLALQPGLVRLLEQRSNGAPTPTDTASQGPVAAEPEVDEELLGGVAAAVALVKAYRTHGHLAARLDPLGSEPPGDPALEPERMVPRLTPELRARFPPAAADVRRRRPRRGAASCKRRTAARSRTRSSTSRITRSECGFVRRSSRAGIASR